MSEACTCEHVDIGIGWQRVTNEPDCPVHGCSLDEDQKLDDEWERALARYANSHVSKHGQGSLPHGYVEGACNDHCNNVECPMRQTHERCTIDCLLERGPSLLEVPVWRGLLLARRSGDTPVTS